MYRADLCDIARSLASRRMRTFAACFADGELASLASVVALRTDRPVNVPLDRWLRNLMRDIDLARRTAA